MKGIKHGIISVIMWSLASLTVIWLNDITSKDIRQVDAFLFMGITWLIMSMEANNDNK